MHNRHNITLNQLQIVRNDGGKLDHRATLSVVHNFSLPFDGWGWEAHHPTVQQVKNWSKISRKPQLLDSLSFPKRSGRSLLNVRVNYPFFTTMVSVLHHYFILFFCLNRTGSIVSCFLQRLWPTIASLTVTDCRIWLTIFQMSFN